jgi:tetratricopeptide (TPR) repeat protein
VWRGHYAEAREHLRAAMDIAPWEAGYPMNLVGAYRIEHLEPPPELDAEILDRIRSQPLSAFASTSLQRYSECLPKGCAYMTADVTRWLEAYLASDQPTFDRSYVHFLLGRAYMQQGRIQDALNAFQRAHDLDPRYLHPLFEQANILLSLRQWDTATLVLDSIRAANEHAYQRLDEQIAQLEAAIAKGREQATAVRILDPNADTPRPSP